MKDDNDDSFKNDDPDFKGIHRKSSKIVIDKEDFYLQNENIITPMRRARLITINGEFWEIAVSAFLCTQELIIQLWNKKPSLFTKLEGITTSLQ